MAKDLGGAHRSRHPDSSLRLGMTSGEQDPIPHYKPASRHDQIALPDDGAPDAAIGLADGRELANLMYRH